MESKFSPASLKGQTILVISWKTIRKAKRINYWKKLNAPLNWGIRKLSTEGSLNKLLLLEMKVWSFKFLKIKLNDLYEIGSTLKFIKWAIWRINLKRHSFCKTFPIDKHVLWPIEYYPQPNTPLKILFLNTRNKPQK